MFFATNTGQRPVNDMFRIKNPHKRRIANTSGERGTINPGQIMIICCKTVRYTSTNNGVYISTTQNSQPYIKWDNFEE